MPIFRADVAADDQDVGSDCRRYAGLMPTSFPEKMLIDRRNFLRLADKVVRDYSDAGSAALLIIDRQKTSSLGIADGRAIMNIITNKLEDCIITLGCARPHHSHG